MTVRCGIDIIYIPKLKDILAQEVALKRFFDPSELADDRLEHLAGIIAAKEAFFKALGIAPPRWHEVRLAYEPGGKPRLEVAPELQTYQSCDVSISHDHHYATAMVILYYD